MKLIQQHQIDEIHKKIDGICAESGIDDAHKTTMFRMSAAKLLAESMAEQPDGIKAFQTLKRMRLSDVAAGIYIGMDYALENLPGIEDPKTFGIITKRVYESHEENLLLQDGEEDPFGD